MTLEMSRRKLSLLLAMLLSGALVMAQGAPDQSPVKPQTPPRTLPPTPQKPPEGILTPPVQTSKDVIRRTVDLVTTTVQVRDSRGAFQANLGKGDFEVYEDGVKQDVITFVLSHGGRVINDPAIARPPAQEGMMLPPPRPTNDSSGRIFMIFVDDLHMDFQNTGRIRDVFHKIAKELVHEGDLFGIVSTGPSSIAIDMTYDRRRLDEAINKISGAGLNPKDIIDTPDGSQGPPEVRHRAHVAFSTAYDILKKFEQVHDRRKAFIYVSDGYDYDPYAKSRAAAAAARDPTSSSNSANGSSTPGTVDPNAAPTTGTNPFDQNGNEFAAADLTAELAELTREANRSNVTIYTIDPRGLVGSPDISGTLDPTEWQDHIRETQNSLRVIADLTGGFAVVNQNDFDKGLKKIDNEMSDYYLLGYYSSNPDPTKRRRNIEIRVTKQGKYDLNYKTQYVLKPPPAVKVPK